MRRRTFLSSLGSMLAWQTARSLHLEAQPAQFTRNPFTLGVASGDPSTHSVILWTRLAPDISAADYGLPAAPVDVRWEVARDSAMRHIVAHGRTAATPELNHSVHLEVKGLHPVHEYFYRFHAGGATSPIGRTKTAPSFHTPTEKVRFAFASCQDYEMGFYVAHRDIAQADLDTVVFLGDYIYEQHNASVPAYRRADIATVRTLEQYRHHYAQHHADPDLQAAHQAHPWIVTLDDHEVEDDWAGDHSVYYSSASLIARRTAAFQAYYENMPLGIASLPQGSHMQIYRALPYGKLVQFTVLDTRQFRTPQPCHDHRIPNCTERLNPDSTMMGAQQEAWFAKTMSSSPAQWNVVANQVMIASKLTETPKGPVYPTDDWDGYVAARRRLTKYLATAKPRNPFIITGDAHYTSVADLKEDFSRKDSPTVASEIVGTSITSDGDGVMLPANESKIRAENPHIHYQNYKRGYIICEANAKQMRSTLRIADKVSTPDGTMSTAASFVLDTDRLGIRQES